MVAILQTLIRDGRLFAWKLAVPGQSCRRTLLLTKEVKDDFEHGAWHDPKMVTRMAQLASDFDRFAAGELIPVGWDPYDKGDNAFMARIDPPEYGVWDIRSTSPRPGLRVLGAFFRRDIFIATHIHLRKNLGCRGSSRWAGAREDALTRWQSLLDTHPPLTGGALHDYLSEETIPV